MELTSDKAKIEIVDGYARAYLKTENCNVCNRFMIIEDTRYNSLFPVYHEMTQKSQIQGTNIQLRSNTKVDDKYICKDCEKSGKADFLCVMCESRKHTGKIKESFGDPPEYLCIDCYETATAKKWEEAVEELNQIHRYDFD